MELEKLSFEQLKKMLVLYEKNDTFSILIRKEMKKKYIDHQNKKMKVEINEKNTEDISYSAKFLSKHPIYPSSNGEIEFSNAKFENPNIKMNNKKKDITIDRDKLNMGIFSRFSNEMEIIDIKKTQKNVLAY